MEPWKASPRSDPTGVITAQLSGIGHARAEYNDPPTDSAGVTVVDVDMSSVTGSATIQIGGIDAFQMGDEIVRELWGVAEGQAWTVASCEGDTLSLNNSAATATYSRTG